MANVTAKAQIATTPWGDDKTKRNLSVGTATTYYPGAMIATNSAGAAVKCDDSTAGLRFDGINATSQPIVVYTTDTLGDKVVTVEKPWTFTAKIASAAITDVGRKVYAKFDDEVAYSGVTNSILVGVVEAYIDATHVEVRPYWTSTSGVNAFDGEDLTFTGATGANDILIPDNLADALSITQGANAYLTFVTTDSAELLYASKKLRVIDNISLTLGDGDDIALTWDATRLNVTQAATNSEIRWGVDGAGIDQRWYGDTASTNMLWDQSDDSLVLSGVAKIKWQTIAAATGTAIPVTHSGSFPITQNGAETNTLAIPTYLGQTLDIFVDTDTSGARVITSAARINQAGNTIITLTEVGDYIRLVAISIAGALRWQVAANDGAALS